MEAFNFDKFFHQGKAMYKCKSCGYTVNTSVKTRNHQCLGIQDGEFGTPGQRNSLQSPILPSPFMYPSGQAPTPLQTPGVIGQHTFTPSVPPPQRPPPQRPPTPRPTVSTPPIPIQENWYQQELQRQALIQQQHMESLQVFQRTTQQNMEQMQRTSEQNMENMRKMMEMLADQVKRSTENRSAEEDMRRALRTSQNESNNRVLKCPKWPKNETFKAFKTNLEI